MVCFVSFFPFQKLLNQSSSLALRASCSSGPNWSLRDKPHSIFFVHSLIWQVHSLRGMPLLAEPPPASRVSPECRSLSHWDTHSPRLRVHSCDVCLLSRWQWPCFPVWANCVMQGAYPAPGDKQGIWKPLACAWYPGLLVLMFLPCHVLCRTSGS